MVILQNVWWLLVLIGIMILIHELGHYWAARFFDVKVEAFSFGFGPRLFGFRRGETDFRFSAILFGGYVKMAGEQPGQEGWDDPRGFLAKPRWQRLVIAFAGPFMNIVLAIAILTGMFMVKYPKAPNTPSPTIGYLLPDGPAAKAGLREGDRIVQVEDKAEPTWQDLAMREVSSANHPLSVWAERNGVRQRFTVTPAMDPKEGVGYAGWSEQRDIQITGLLPGIDVAGKAGLRPGDILVAVNGNPIRSTPNLPDLIAAAHGSPVQIDYVRSGQKGTAMVTPVKTTLDGQERWMIGVKLEPKQVFTRLPFPEALKESVHQNIKGAGMIYNFLWRISERRMSAKSLSGPIGIAQASGEAAREGAAAFFALMAMVSLNLAIFNLLPIPILDGGIILMLLVEMVMRRDLSLQVKESVFRVGFVFLMAVVAFVLYNDISKLL